MRSSSIREASEKPIVEVFIYSSALILLCDQGTLIVECQRTDRKKQKSLAARIAATMSTNQLPNTRRQLAAESAPHEERKTEQESRGAEVEFGNTTQFGLSVIFR